MEPASGSCRVPRLAGTPLVGVLRVVQLKLPGANVAFVNLPDGRASWAASSVTLRPSDLLAMAAASSARLKMFLTSMKMGGLTLWTSSDSRSQQCSGQLPRQYGDVRQTQAPTPCLVGSREELTTPGPQRSRHQSDRPPTARGRQSVPSRTRHLESEDPDSATPRPAPGSVSPSAGGSRHSPKP